MYTYIYIYIYNTGTHTDNQLELHAQVVELSLKQHGVTTRQIIRMNRLTRNTIICINIPLYIYIIQVPIYNQPELHVDVDTYTAEPVSETSLISCSSCE